MAHRNIVAITMLFLATLASDLRASEPVTPAEGVLRARLQVAGIV
jgi:hypothetical protein